MPGKVRFETEYNSSFKGYGSDVSKIIKSPVLKPRASEGSVIAPIPILKKKSKNEAGITSSASHSTREPPLQHKKAFAQAKTADEIAPVPLRDHKKRDHFEATTNKNPVLDYAAKVETAKTNERESFKDDKFAGRESYNQSYQALEPPMQRKRRSPYCFNHNILRTDTIPPVNGSSDDAENNQVVAETVFDPKATETVKRKLEFEQPTERDVPVESVFPVKTADWRLREDTFKKENKLQKDHFEQSKRERKQRRSPAKEQRKKDLNDVKNKQNERVDRALMIKAGMQTVEPPLYSHPVKTEYQRQFAWKESVRHAIYPKNFIPIEVENAELAPEEVPKRKFKPFKSEYQLQFKEYPLTKEVPAFSKASQKPSSEITGDEVEKKEGTHVVDKRLLHLSRNVQPLFAPRGKSNLETEYKSSFIPPAKLSPGKAPSSKAKDENNRQETVDQSESLDWFKEVLRLRERAQSYKERTQETHYPTVFLASLNDDYDDESVSEEDVPIEAAKKANVSVQVGASRAENVEDARNPEPEVDKGEYAESGKDKVHYSAAGVKSDIPVLKKPKKSAGANGSSNQGIKSAVGKFAMKAVARDEKLGQKQDEEALEAIPYGDEEIDVQAEEEPRIHSPIMTSSSDEGDSVMSLLKGRIETPRLRSGVEPRRHNLDRTTPLRGGTIAHPGPKLSSGVTAPVHEFRTLEAAEGHVKPKRWAQDVTVRNASGKDARYNPITHSGPEIIRETRPKHVHHQKTYRHDKYEDNEIEADLLVSDLEEQGGAYKAQLYKSSKYKQRDERPEVKHTRTLRPPRAFVQPSDVGQNLDNTAQSDVLSDTSMSARDSVISDVLERSRRRRDDFW